MVFYFTSTGRSAVVSPSYTIYMGRDKHENEELIRWGWPEDVWFHVDKLSSAHVYLRLHAGETVDTLPQTVIDDCAQLVKANSIQGCKQNDVGVVYTAWANLKKTAGMDVGQVSFHKHKEVKNIIVEKKINEILNRLNKTKTETEFEDFRALREARDDKERQNEKKKQQLQKQREKEEEKVKEEQASLRSYDSLMSEDNMKTNRDIMLDDDDDFM